MTILTAVIGVGLAAVLWFAGSELLRWLDARSRINRRLAASLKP